MGGEVPDLVQVFFSPHHTSAARAIQETIRLRLDPRCLLGVSSEGVIGGNTELEKAPGVSILAARLPGVALTPFSGEELLPADDSPEGLARLALATGAMSRQRAMLLYADPFSVPMVKLLPALNKAIHIGRPPSDRLPIVGGMASGARSPGGNALILNDRVMTSGLIGVSIAGNIRVDAVVSQGCRPFGPPSIVTRAKGNLIFELGGRPAPEVVREAIAELAEKAKSVLSEGLLVGLVINEYKDRFGRDDFLIRNVVGLDSTSGGIAVNDIVRVGQTIRFHHRDRDTASQDLAMLLDAQQLKDRPAGVLLITCNGRGARMFGSPHHDAAAVARAFSVPLPGEELAKGGIALDPAAPAASSTFSSAESHVPVAGFFAAGEIGPVSGESFLHGQTACIALFRELLPDAAQA
jgi:small ligand-binding sensory domain FIST